MSKTIKIRAFSRLNIDDISPPKIIVILGPTASGKTALSIKLARLFNGEIVSADSRQIYKGLDLGSGKITKKEMAGIPHYLLSIANPKHRYSVSDYKNTADKIIEEIIKRGKTPILVGGTGFYIQAIVDNICLPEVAPNPTLRKSLDKLSLEELRAKLKKLDPEKANNIDAKNKVRLVRALEIADTLGHVPKILPKKSPYQFIQIGLSIGQSKLKENIKKRLQTRLKKGMIAEVRNLHQAGLSWKRLEELGLEYRYLAKFLQKKISREDMMAKIESESLKFAKRQMTWFKRDKRIIWVKDEKEAKNKIVGLFARTKK